MSKNGNSLSRKKVNGSTGLQSESRAYGHPWSDMSKKEKLSYEFRVKESKNAGATNKYTAITGESFAQLQSKMNEQRFSTEKMEFFIDRLAQGPDSGSHNYIFITASCCLGKITDNTTRIYWPGELSMVVFSLKKGIQRIYTQIVDVGTIPCGHAGVVMEFAEENGLPLPHTKAFQSEYNDYLSALKKLMGLANHWLKTGYDVPGHSKVFFALENEREPIRGCLQWMVDKLSGEDKKKYQFLLDNLKIYPASKLVLSMAEEAHTVNQFYNSGLVKFKLESAAEDLLLGGLFEYRKEITCKHHRTGEAGLKAHKCSQSRVLRRIFTLFFELIPAYGYEFTNRHKIDALEQTQDNKQLFNLGCLKPRTLASRTSIITAPPPSRSAWRKQPVPVTTTSCEDNADDFPMISKVPMKTNYQMTKSMTVEAAVAESLVKKDSDDSPALESLSIASKVQTGDSKKRNKRKTKSNFGPAWSTISDPLHPVGSFVRSDNNDLDFPALGDTQGRGQAETHSKNYMENEDDFPPLGVPVGQRGKVGSRGRGWL